MRAFRGRPSVLMRTSTLSTDGSKGVRAESTALDGHSGSQAIVRGQVDVFGDYIGRDRELDLADVADGDSVGPAGCLNHGTEGPELAVLDVNAHLHRGVVGSVPELDVGVERSAFGAEDDLHLFHGRGAVRPGTERSTLNEDLGVRDGSSAGWHNTTAVVLRLGALHAPVPR